MNTALRYFIGPFVGSFLGIFIAQRFPPGVLVSYFHATKPQEEGAFPGILTYAPFSTGTWAPMKFMADPDDSSKFEKVILSKCEGCTEVTYPMDDFEWRWKRVIDILANEQRFLKSY